MCELESETNTMGYRIREPVLGRPGRVERTGQYIYKVSIGTSSSLLLGHMALVHLANLFYVLSVLVPKRSWRYNNVPFLPNHTQLDLRFDVAFQLHKRCFNYGNKTASPVQYLQCSSNELWTCFEMCDRDPVF